MTLSLQNGDIVLVSFPFTDLSGVKLRPAVVISTQAVHKMTGDFTLLFISSVVPKKTDPFELAFRATHSEFEMSGLKKDSLFKTNKITTISERLIKRKLGSLGKKIRQELRATLSEAIKI